MRDDEVPWGELIGGYGVPYDPRCELEAVEKGAASWNVLWEQLHHQGDVGSASYAAIPRIALIAESVPAPGWNPFALAATIEEARLDGDNPDLPLWLAEDYATAWESLFHTALNLLGEAEEELLIRSLFAVLAIHKRLPLLGRIALLSERERRDIVEELSWV